MSQGTIQEHLHSVFSEHQVNLPYHLRVAALCMDWNQLLYFQLHEDQIQLLYDLRKALL